MFTITRTDDLQFQEEKEKIGTNPAKPQILRSIGVTPDTLEEEDFEQMIHVKNENDQQKKHICELMERNKENKDLKETIRCLNVLVEDQREENTALKQKLEEANILNKRYAGAVVEEEEEEGTKYVCVNECGEDCECYAIEADTNEKEERKNNKQYNYDHVDFMHEEYKYNSQTCSVCKYYGCGYFYYSDKSLDVPVCLTCYEHERNP